MKANFFLSSLLPLIVASSPIVERAGGPAAVPIPKQCTVINPLPHANCGTANVNGWMPNSTWVKQNLLYQANFDGFLSNEAQAKQCK